MSYKIIRHFFEPRESFGRKRVIARGLSLEQAQAWCQDPETSSSTCTKPHNVRRTREQGPWFDGYSEE